MGGGEPGVGTGLEDPGAGVPPGWAERLGQEPGLGSLQGWGGHRTHPRSVAAWPPRGPRVLQEGPRQSLSPALEPRPLLWSGGAGPPPPLSPQDPSPALHSSLHPGPPPPPPRASLGPPRPGPGVASYLSSPSSPGPSSCLGTSCVPPMTPRANTTSSTAPPPPRGSPEAATQMP